MSVIRKGKLATALTGADVVVSAVGKTLVELPSATGGATVLLDITGQSWTIGWAASFQNAVFGITDAAWASAMPWFIYLINGTNATAGVQLGMSRSPVYRFAPVEADFAYSDAACSGTDDQGIVAVSYVDGTDYNGKPMSLIGAVTMTYDATKWVPSLTISAANSGGCTEDALRDAFSTEYTMPVGQNDANSGKYFYSAGTPPTFTTNNVGYKILPYGGVILQVYLDGNTGTDGAGANSMQLALPYSASSAMTYAPSFMYLAINAVEYQGAVGTIGSGATRIALNYFSALNTIAAVNCDLFGDTARSLMVSTEYQAF